MRKVIVTEFITLDGVIQAPGGDGEDPRLPRHLPAQSPGGVTWQK